MNRYLMHGLVLESDIALSHDRTADSGPADVRVELAGKRAVPGRVATGEVLQSVAAEEGMLYSTVARPDGTVLVRVHSHVDFEIRADLRSVSAWQDPASDPEMAGIFVSGLLASVLLMLLGHPVLHASAVEIDGHAVAFVADSGMGKSTLAALACARGARFVTDDVLRLRFDDDRALCWLGATDNRLRRDLPGLPVAEGTGSVRTTVDGRLAWRPPRSDHELCRLQSIVLPAPDREARVVDLVRLPAAEAILELTRHPRIQGWRDAAGRGALFATLSRLVATTPVFTARIPWGPPFEPDVLDELLRRTGLAVR